MKKILLIFTSILFLLCLSSCNYPPETSSEEIQTPEETQNQEESLSQEIDTVYYPNHSITLQSEEELHTYWEEQKPPDYVIPYEKLSFLGEFHKLDILDTTKYDSYYYTFSKDNYQIVLSIDHFHEPITSTLSDFYFQEYHPDNDLRHNYPPYHDIVNYEYRGIVYMYGTGILSVIAWTSNETNYYLMISNSDFTQYNSSDSFINLFLSKDTAELALQIFDEMINASHKPSLPQELISVAHTLLEMQDVNESATCIYDMEDYGRFLATESTPESFIQYDQLSNFGDLKKLIIEPDYQRYMYLLQQGNHQFYLQISPLTSSEPSTSENESNQENEIVNQPNSDLRHLPNKETGVYRYHGIQYHYQKGNLIWMNWTSNEIQYLLICSPCWSDYELDNPIINNFLNKDTAEQAIQTFDEMLNSSTKPIQPLKIGSDGTYTVSLAMPSEGSILQGNIPYQQDAVWSQMQVNKPVPSLQVGNKKLENLTQIQIDKSDWGQERHIFLNADKTQKITIDKSSHSFFVNSLNDSTLYTYPNPDLTENGVVQAVKEYVRSFVPDFDFEKYQYSCSTYVTAQSLTGAAWADNKNYFYSLPTEIETIRWYIIEFVKCVNGTPTADEIRVTVDPAGNITKLSYFQYDMDWSLCEVDWDLVEECTEKFVYKFLDSRYELSTYEINHTCLVCINGSAKLMVGVDVAFHLTHDNDPDDGPFHWLGLFLLE